MTAKSHWKQQFLNSASLIQEKENNLLIKILTKEVFIRLQSTDGWKSLKKLETVTGSQVQEQKVHNANENRLDSLN